jgi:hypothetical protein
MFIHKNSPCLHEKMLMPMINNDNLPFILVVDKEAIINIGETNVLVY